MRKSFIRTQCPLYLNGQDQRPLPDTAYGAPDPSGGKEENHKDMLIQDSKAVLNKY